MYWLFPSSAVEDEAIQPQGNTTLWHFLLLVNKECFLIIIYLFFFSNPRHNLSLFLAALALLSKETGVVAIPLNMAFGLWKAILRQKTPSKLLKKRLLKDAAVVRTQNIFYKTFL